MSPMSLPETCFGKLWPMVRSWDRQPSRSWREGLLFPMKWSLGSWKSDCADQIALAGISLMGFRGRSARPRRSQKFSIFCSIYIISDQLITDYSSVFFDYAILNRPIYFYMFDFETYRDDLRGFYLQVPKALPNDICYTQDQLLTAISSGQFNFKRLAAFNEKFNHLQDGKASRRVIDEVFI